LAKPLVGQGYRIEKTSGCVGHPLIRLAKPLVGQGYRIDKTSGCVGHP
jgi:hypothetical protein